MGRFESASLSAMVRASWPDIRRRTASIWEETRPPVDAPAAGDVFSFSDMFIFVGADSMCVCAYLGMCLLEGVDGIGSPLHGGVLLLCSLLNFFDKLIGHRPQDPRPPGPHTSTDEGWTYFFNG